MPKTQSEDQCEEQKKCARDLKPQDTADTAEGAQESCYAAADASTGLGRELSGCLPGGAALDYGAGDELDSVGLGRAGAGLSLVGQPLSHNAACNSHSNAQRPADD